MDVNSKAIVRGVTADNFPEDSEQKFQMSPSGALIVATGLPDSAELVRLGGSFYAVGGTPAVSLAGAVPTTVASSTLWNGELADGKSLIITACYAKCTTSAGAATQFQLFGESSLLRVATVPTTSDAGVIRGLISGKVYGGKAITSVTVTVTNNGWFPIGPTVETALTGTVGYSIGGKLPVPVIVPPGHYFALATVGVNATSEFSTMYVFHEARFPVAS